MMCDDASKIFPRHTVGIVQPSWIAGAVAGIKASPRRTPDWTWDRFIEELYDTADQLGGIGPLEPASTPTDECGLVGSAYDTLGGYVSTAGEIRPEGLYFTVSSERHEDVLSLFPGFVLLRTRGGIIVPHYEIASFLKLVPVNGPLVDQLEEAEMR